MAQGFGFNDQDSINELTGQKTPPERLRPLTLPYLERRFAVEQAQILDFHNLGRRLKIPEVHYRPQVTMTWPQPSPEDAHAFLLAAEAQLPKKELPKLSIPENSAAAREQVSAIKDQGIKALNSQDIPRALYSALLCRAELHETPEQLKELQHQVDLIYNEALSVLFALYVLHNSVLTLPPRPAPIPITPYQQNELQCAMRGLSSVFPSDFQGSLRTRYRLVTISFRLFLGRFDDAESELHRYFEQELHRENKDHIDARLFVLRAYIYWQREQLKGIDNALALHDKTLGAETQSPGVLTLRVLRAYHSGSWNKALDPLKALLKLDPKSRPLRHDLAYVYFKLLRPAVTREILEDRFRNEALSYLGDLHEQGQDRDVRLFYASCLQQSQDPEKAYRILKDSLSPNDDMDSAELKHFAGLFAYEAGYQEQAHQYFLEAFESLTKIHEESSEPRALDLFKRVRASLYFSLTQRLCRDIESAGDQEPSERGHALHEAIVRVLPFTGVLKAELTDFGFSLGLGYLLEELRGGFRAKARLGPSWLDSAAPGGSRVEIYQCYRALSERRIKTAFQHEWASRDSGQSRVPLYLIFLTLDVIKKLPEPELQSLLDQFGLSTD